LTCALEEASWVGLIRVGARSTILTRVVNTRTDAAVRSGPIAAANADTRTLETRNRDGMVRAVLRCVTKRLAVGVSPVAVDAGSAVLGCIKQGRAYIACSSRPLVGARAVAACVGIARHVAGVVGAVRCCCAGQVAVWVCVKASGTIPAIPTRIVARGAGIARPPTPFVSARAITPLDNIPRRIAGVIVAVRWGRAPQEATRVVFIRVGAFAAVQRCVVNIAAITARGTIPLVATLAIASTGRVAKNRYRMIGAVCLYRALE
jgi:hypothetical protein